MMLENRKENLRIESVNTMSEFEKPPHYIFINPSHYIEEKSSNYCFIIYLFLKVMAKKMIIN